MGGRGSRRHDIVPREQPAIRALVRAGGAVFGATRTSDRDLPENQMKVQFAKAHGDGNDFLLVRGLAWAEDADYAALARAICDRHRGVGADGLVVFTGPARIRLFNSDGSEAELSGNGTRCAAALLAADGEAHSAGASPKPAEESPGQAGDTFDIETTAGRKHL